MLLIGIWSGMGVCQAAVAAFIDQNRKQPVAPRLSGYILPGGWIVWGGLWVYAVDQTIDFKSEEKSA